jgi:hypothetical protein
MHKKFIKAFLIDDIEQFPLIWIYGQTRHATRISCGSEAHSNGASKMLWIYTRAASAKKELTVGLDMTLVYLVYDNRSFSWLIPHQVAFFEA